MVSRIAAALIALFSSLMPTTVAASSGGAPAFDVASVKSRGPLQGGDTLEGARYFPNKATYDLTFRGLLMVAYKKKYNQRSGPAWIDSEHYEIAAKFPERTPTDTVRLMLQNLLFERFGLKVHTYSKTVARFALRAAKPGPGSGPHATKNR